jgi:hypothetical protein
MRPSRTWRAVLAGSRNIRIEDAIRLAEAFGFVLRRTRGSHRILLQPEVPDGLNLQLDRNDCAKAYQPRQLVAIVETHGLTLAEP